MKILLDHAGMSRLAFGWVTSDYSCQYVANAPTRAIVTFQNGLDANLLTGSVVEAQSGKGVGLAGRVRISSVGEVHTKIVLIQRVNGPPDATLSQMLNDARQDHRAERSHIRASLNVAVRR